MKLTHFEVKFDNPQGVFTAGTAVSGYVMINLSKPMKMRSIKIQFRGDGKSHWSKRRGKHTMHYRESELYVNASINLFGGDSQGGSTEHPAGNHAYPFSLQISDTLPSSFEGSRGYVRYFCRCTIDRPWKFDSHVKRAFTVIHHLDLNQNPQAPIPINAQTRREIDGCCCSAGTVEVTLTINKTGYVPGEPIVFDIHIDNQSDFAVTHADMTLIQTTTYQGKQDGFFSSGMPKYHPKMASFSLLQYNCRIKPQTTEEINRATLVPSLPPSHLDGCGIINIDYTVQLKVSCSGSKVKIEKGILIGTIPLHEPTFQLPTTPTVPTAPCAPSVEPLGPITLQPQSITVNIDTPSPLPVPPSYEEALAPPPSYSECIYGRMSIRDANDDANTTGDVTWAPAYPYYDWSTLPYRGQRPEVGTAGPPQYDNDD